jgi:hypothetical protein
MRLEESFNLIYLFSGTKGAKTRDNAGIHQGRTAFSNHAANLVEIVLKQYSERTSN